MRLARPISAVLCLSLVLSCCLPCYAWAAVDGQEAVNGDSVFGEQLDGSVGVAPDGAAAGGDSGSSDTDTAEEVGNGSSDGNTHSGNYGASNGSGLSDNLRDSPLASEQNPSEARYYEPADAGNVSAVGQAGEQDTVLSGQAGESLDSASVQPRAAPALVAALINAGISSAIAWATQSSVSSGDDKQITLLGGILDQLYYINNSTAWLGGIETNVANLLRQVLITNERLGSVISYLSPIRDYSDGIYKRLGGINDTAAQMNERLGSQLGYVSNIRDYSKGAYDRLGTIMDALYQNGTTEAAYSEGIYKRLGTVMDLLTRIADKDYSASLDADLTPVTDRLDEIARLLSPSGQSSLLDSFLGDFTMPVSSALSAQVQAAMQSAFPFCIPAILKQVLGLMEVDPSAASVEFDILGATCTLDLSAGGFASGIATVTSWLCRILFALVLICSTPRFVFALPGRGS